MRRVRLALLTLVLVVATAALFPRTGRTAPDDVDKVILVTTDGLRWQEVFSGAEEALMSKEEGVAKPPALKQAFWRDTPEERRKILLPFVWSVVAEQGQIYGSQAKGSLAHVTNGKNFSYPGYNELLTGAPDPRIDSNDKKPNPNRNVLEWFDAKPGFHGRVAAFCSWDTFPFILNRERNGLPINAGWEPTDERPLAEKVELAAMASHEIPGPWDEVRFDVLTFQAAFDYLKQKKPRVLYISLGETDEWGHLGRYDEYLRAAQRVDGFVKLLWETAQSLPEYRGKTSILLTADHGRGYGHEWRSHGVKIKGSENIWMAVLGPRTKAMGEMSAIDPVTQSQVAATVAALVGEDYAGEVKTAAPPLKLAVGPRFY
jgi:hypothetical protein